MRWLVPVVLAVLGCHEVRLPNRTQLPSGGYGGANGHPDYPDRFTGNGPGGSGGTCSTPLESDVSEEGPTPAAITGGTLAALRGGGFVIGDPDRALVWLVSADSKQIRSVPLSAGDEPGRVIEGADGLAYVSLRRAGQLAEVDFAAGTMRRLDTCDLPRGLAWRAQDARLIVACLGGSIESIDPLTAMRTPLVTSRPLDDLRDVVVDGDRLLVTQFRSAAVLSIAADGAVTQLTTEPVYEATPHVAWRAVPRPGGAVIVRQQHRTRTLAAESPCGYYGSGSGGGPGLRGIVDGELLTVSGTTAVRTSLSTAFALVVLPVDVAISAAGRIAVISAGTGGLTVLRPGSSINLTGMPRGVDTQLTSVVFVAETAIAFAREPATLLVQSVEDWLQLQPALPPPPLDQDAKVRGEAAFVAAGCRGCHSGAQGTNNWNGRPVPTFTVVVPRLTEFAWRNPWFHDGRMQTLQDRFAPSAGGQMHGEVEAVSVAQRADLLVYLQSR